MPETAYDEKYVNGVVVQSTPRTISDDEIVVRDAPKRLLQAVSGLQQWKADYATWSAEAEAVNAAGGTPTAAQLRGLFHRSAQSFDHLSVLSDRLYDLIRYLVEQR